MPRPAGKAFRPSLWLTLFTVPAFAVLIGLGVWQLERRDWKHRLVQELQARESEDALTVLPASITPEIEFRRVELAGHYVAGREQLIVGRSNEGRTGYGVFTPFELADGRLLFADRGWIPLTAKADPSWQASPQPVTLSGIGRIPHEPETNAQTAIGNEHYRLDLGTMARQAGLDRQRLLPLYVIADGPEGAGVLPIPRKAAVELTDNHLQYAMTWFSLAAALVAIYLLASRRERATGATS